MRDSHWPLLDALTINDRLRVIRESRRQRFRRNEIIFHEGDAGEVLYLLGQGHVALRIHTPMGDIATMRIVRPGDFFGELALVTAGPRSATAVALDAVETLVVSRAQLSDLRVENRQIDALLIKALATEVRRLASQAIDVMYVPAEKRLLRKLCELAMVFGSDSTQAECVPVTQETLAQIVGCTRPTANRVLKAAEDEGYIAVTRGKVEILDADRLARRAR